MNYKQLSQVLRYTIDHKIEPDQGDGFKITTDHGHIKYRPRPEDDTNEIWWVESHKKDHGLTLVDLMQQHHPASNISWGATSIAGEGLRQRWHKLHPEVSGGEGRSYPHEGQFNPYEDRDEDEEDNDNEL